MKKNVFLILMTVMIISCKTIDMEKSDDLVEIKENEITLPVEQEVREVEVNGTRIREDELVYEIDPYVIETTKYIVVDKSEIKADAQKKPVNEEAVKQSLKDSYVTLEDFTGGTSWYDYDENSQFPIFTRQLALTTIMLNDDEYMPEGSSPYMSDTDRWEITGDVWMSDNGERQLIMIKPKALGLETNMMVVTNKRIYHFILYSTKNNYQPMVRFRYPKEKEFITSRTKKVLPSAIRTTYESDNGEFLSFNYKVTVPLASKKVDWIPNRVYDDGTHTYILLPEVVLQKEFPAVWENNNEILNYEIDPEIHNLIIINKLVEKVTLRVGKKKVVIRKKKGEAKPLTFKRGS